MSAQDKAGMYNVGNADYPQIKVGDFTLLPQNNSSTWIQNGEGEGAEFPNELLEKFIGEFFSKHF